MRIARRSNAMRGFRHECGSFKSSHTTRHSMEISIRDRANARVRIQASRKHYVAMSARAHMEDNGQNGNFLSSSQK